MINAKEIKDPHGLAFLAATKGIDAWTVARVIHTFGVGSDWRGCTKGDIAESYARAMNKDRFAISALTMVKLDKLRARCLAAKAGQRDWHKL